MNRQQLEHLIRAAGTITHEQDIVIVGSQSILGAVPNADASFLQSFEADMFPLTHPQKAEELNDIGMGSLFHETHGFYADPVDETTAKLPIGWKDRLVKIQNENTNGVTGWCLDTNDLAVSKLMAFRDKDLDFVKAMLGHKLATPDILRERITHVNVVQELKDNAIAWLNRQSLPK